MSPAASVHPHQGQQTELGASNTPPMRSSGASQQTQAAQPLPAHSSSKHNTSWLHARPKGRTHPRTTSNGALDIAPQPEQAGTPRSLLRRASLDAALAVNQQAGTIQHHSKNWHEHRTPPASMDGAVGESSAGCFMQAAPAARQPRPRQECQSNWKGITEITRQGFTNTLNADTILDKCSETGTF
ncbi:hypothetical protein NDU88_001686 [Pleurodeles waltl]|uniref:Uncharacterized protein n=1 Tax=Pleurodeles waltl TaxID=8319 RepID=A0AAV7RB28_PLEWA|nr:hypothetical protein NDU88_001686 [Pleurodeles waltl]